MPSRPLALSSNGQRLYAVNTPDAHLEIFDVSGATPVRIGSVPVGLEPMAVSLRTDGEAWVVNHLSDSISIVDVSATPPRVTRTLQVGDAPSDVIFAGPGRGRAFVTTAHRGQNTLDPLGGYATEGIGRADVWIFDAVNPPTDLVSYPSVTILSLFTDRPRALAASADGSTVYAAGFMTGNRTTVIGEGIVCDGPTSTTCIAPEPTGSNRPDVTVPGGLPEPRRNFEYLNGPDVGLIVRYDALMGKWVDELDRDWSPFVRFELPDYDVFAIDANATTPSVTAQIPHVGTILFAMATNPVNGRLYVANTEAFNHVRFEGMGTFVRENNFKPAGEPASVRGHLHEARITVVNGTSATPRHLNTHLDYDAFPQPASARNLSVAQPMGIAVSGDGSTLYISAFGSSALSVVPTAALEAGTYTPTASNFVGLTGGGPTGVALDEARARIFVATRFDDGISVVSTTTKQETAHVVMHTPEPTEVVWGRPFLYDARLSSSTGEASCGSCHVHGDVDGLAWDLGDPDGERLLNTNPNAPVPAVMDRFHPLKGPMTTQTFRGISTHGPMHWRGDRTAGGANAGDEHAAFMAFAPAFPGLLGRDEGEISEAEMDLFTQFVLSMDLPPNPMRQLDNSLRANEQAARNFYFNTTVDTQTCNACHVLDPAQGFFGTSGLMSFENEPQSFKVAQLRNMYEKVGMFGMPYVRFNNEMDDSPTGPQIRGFGFLHDGSTDTTFNFFHAVVFSGLDGNDTMRRNMEAFMMVFDTDLAPIVGQQVTIDAASTPAHQTRLDLLHARAGTAFALHGATGARECDLVAHGVVNGEQRGFLRQADGNYTSDRAAEPTRTKAELVTLASAAGQYLTFTCTPPGSGTRMALDRDEDGVRNRDELDMSRDPADRPLTTNPLPTTPDGGVGEDAGLDAGVDAGGDGGVGEKSGGGCGCVTAGDARDASGAAWLATLALVATLARRRDRR